MRSYYRNGKWVYKGKRQELLELVGLKESSKKRIGSYSRGMKQRLGIAQALLNEPSLLICDEPTSALDPLGRIDILDILLKAKEKTTVIFSTHILSDVERICDTIAILDEGRVVMAGELEKLKERHGIKSSSGEFRTTNECRTFQKKCEELLIKGLEEEREPSLEKLFLEVIK